MHTLIHLLLCAGIVAACICRLNNDVCRRFRRARLRVMLFLGGALASAAQPLIFGSFATISESLLAGALLASLVLNADRWWRSYVSAKDAS